MYVLAREDGYRTNLELAGGLRNDVNAIVGRNKLLFSKGIIKTPWLHLREPKLSCIHLMMGLLAIYTCSQAYLSIYYTGLTAKLFIFQSPLSSHLTTRLSSSALKKLLISFK